MDKLDAIFEAIDLAAVRKEVGLKHEQARVAYDQEIVTVDTYNEFRELIGDYYRHHFVYCTGGSISKEEAQGEAELLITRQYNDPLHIFKVVKARGGLNKILDGIADYFKSRAIENHIANIFATYLPKDQDEEQMRILIELFKRYGPHLKLHLNIDCPAMYINQHENLIRGIAKAIDEFGDKYRGM